MTVRSRLHFIRASAATLTLLAVASLAAAPQGPPESIVAVGGWYGAVLTLPDGTQIPNQVYISSHTLVRDGEIAESSGGRVDVPVIGFSGKFVTDCTEVAGDISVSAFTFTEGEAGPFIQALLGTNDLTGWVFVSGVRDGGVGPDATPDLSASTPFYPPGFDPCMALALEYEDKVDELNSPPDPVEGPNVFTNGNVLVRDLDP